MEELITVPMTAAMRRRARAALAADELPADTSLTPREYRRLVLYHMPLGVTKHDYRTELTREGWFTTDESYAETVNGERRLCAAADERVRVDLPGTETDPLTLMADRVNAITGELLARGPAITEAFAAITYTDEDDFELTAGGWNTGHL